jgi:hypothetical protein
MGDVGTLKIALHPVVELTFGSLYLSSLIYVVGANLTQADIDGVMDITYPGMLVTTLANDVYSFDKEVADLGGADMMVNNAVAFVIRETNMRKDIYLKRRHQNTKMHS